MRRIKKITIFTKFASEVYNYLKYGFIIYIFESSGI